METIEFRDVSFSYAGSERLALQHIDLALDTSAFTVVCGKSGCGKSTLLRQLKKNLIPYGKSQGQVLWNGQEIAEMADRESAWKIGFVQQNPDHQIVTDKVWHELAFGLESLGCSNSEMRRRVAEMASYFGIHTWFHKKVSELSGGQKQLLNLASILVMQPKLLILDEPTAQLDPIAASDFLHTLLKINQELGTGIFISEHRLEEVFPMADKAVVMEDGKILYHDTPRVVAGKLAVEPGTQGMYYGLPSVTRIYGMLKENGVDDNCPLSVREGKQWMEQWVRQKDPLAGQEKGQQIGLEPARPSEKLKPKKDQQLAIEIQDIWFRYSRNDKDILQGLSLKVEPGQWFCVLGGNGAGKSTMLKAVCGNVKPQRGQVRVDGILVGKRQESQLFKQRLAMLPQNPQAVFTEITAEEDLLEALYGSSYSDQEKVQRVEEMLEQLELTELRATHPYDLSGGEQQRLALGKVLLQEPTILLLDEPTKGLDPFFKRKLARILCDLREQGVTIFMVSHDLEFCAEYADQCALFFDSNIVAVDTPANFFSGNSFYTTAANRMARDWFPRAVTCEEVAEHAKRL